MYYTWSTPELVAGPKLLEKDWTFLILSIAISRFYGFTGYFSFRGVIG